MSMIQIPSQIDNTNNHTDDDVVIEDMSIDLLCLINNNSDATLNPPKQRITNANKESKDNNIPELPSNASYHGEYAKALIDTLDNVLDKSMTNCIEHPSIWLQYFSETKEFHNQIKHFYPILLNELNQKIKKIYISEFEKISAKKHLAFLQRKLMFATYKKGISEDCSEDCEELIQYRHPTDTARNQELKLVNRVFMNEIQSLDQKIATAKYKKNELIAKIEEKKKTFFQK